MTTKIGVGKSNKKDSYQAGIAAATSAFSQAGVDSCDFVFVFSTVGFVLTELISGIRSVTKEVPLVGGTGDGIITQAGPEGLVMFTLSGSQIGDDAVAVMVIASDEIKFHSFLGRNLSIGSYEVGKSIAKSINENKAENPLILLTFPDSYKVNMKQFFEGLEGEIYHPLPIAGGATGHNLGASTIAYQFYNNEVLTDTAPCVLISGNIKTLTGVNHGCVPIGLEKTVTKAESNIIYQIENKSTWSFFQEYLGEDVKELDSENATAISLGIKLDSEMAADYGNYIVRAPTVKRDDGSVFFATEIPEGTKVQVVRRDEDKISQGARNLAKQLKQKLGGKKPQAVLHFDCSGRGKIFFEDRVKELGVDVIQDELGKDIPWLGFYTFGEIAPIKGKNQFHNHTVVLLLLW